MPLISGQDFLEFYRKFNRDIFLPSATTKKKCTARPHQSQLCIKNNVGTRSRRIWIQTPGSQFWIRVTMMRFRIRFTTLMRIRIFI